MKFEVRIESGDHTSNHVLEFPSLLPKSANHGELQFIFDGKAGKADWAEVRPGVYSLIRDGKSCEVRASAATASRGSNGSYEIATESGALRVALQDSRARHRSASTTALNGPHEVLAPMPGRVVKILVAENSNVKAGQGLLVIEAMKMHNELRAPHPGRVTKIHVQEGEGVESGARLVLLI